MILEYELNLYQKEFIQHHSAFILFPLHELEQKSKVTVGHLLNFWYRTRFQSSIGFRPSSMVNTFFALGLVVSHTHVSHCPLNTEEETETTMCRVAVDLCLDLSNKVFNLD